ncbi:MAG: NfeD family protein [Candidatus Izemoplasmatales bacterium]|nr:NfeD family protein [Candidatus Izemoplasmatales bacterium]NLF48099.1 NfeD family protein [Acholeplasmataceae bacterium]
MFLALDLGTTMILIWFGVIVLAGIIEASTMDLTSIWFSVGALFALIIAVIWGDNVILQAVIFIVVSILLLLGLRPVFKKYIRKNEIKTNADKLVGRTAICIKPIVNGERGEVKIEGKIWTAISNEDIQLDEKVEVLSIDGVKLVVKKQQ